MEISIPDKFKHSLGQYGVVITEGNQDLAWGYPVLGEKLGHEPWEELGKLGRLEFDVPTKAYVLVTKAISDRELSEIYGPLSNVEYGPRGGYKSITFGTTKFKSKLFKR